MKYRFRKDQQLIPVIEPQINQLYHVEWGWSRGIVGKCISIDKEKKTVILITPTTNKEFKYPVKWDELRHTRKNQVKNPH